MTLILPVQAASRLCSRKQNSLKTHRHPDGDTGSGREGGKGRPTPPPEREPEVTSRSRGLSRSGCVCGGSPLAAFLCSFPPGVALTWSSGGEGSPLAFSLNLRNEQPGEPLGSHKQKPGRQAAEGPGAGVKAPRRVAPRSGGSRRCTERVRGFPQSPRQTGTFISAAPVLTHRRPDVTVMPQLCRGGSGGKLSVLLTFLVLLRTSSARRGGRAGWV